MFERTPLVPSEKTIFRSLAAAFPRDQWIGRSATKFTIPLSTDFERDLGQLLVYNEGQARRIFLLTASSIGPVQSKEYISFP